MRHLDVGVGDGENGVHVTTKVEKDWLSDAYLFHWNVVYEYETTFYELAKGTEVFGPLWEATQVEGFVRQRLEALRSTPWRHEILEVEQRQSRQI